MGKHDDHEILQDLLNIAGVGWWKANLTTRQYHCSDFLCDLFGLTQGEVLTFDAYRLMVDEDYREFVFGDVNAISSLAHLNRAYPMYSRTGEKRWIRTKVARIVQDEQGNRIVYGVTLIVDDIEVETIKEELAHIKEQLVKQQTMSSSLSHFIRENDPVLGIMSIQADLLRLFDAQRTYICEYDETLQYHSCIYETPAEGIASEKDIRQRIPSEITPYCAEHILNGRPVFINSTDEPPLGAEADCEIFRAMGVKSFLIVPLMLGDTVWGFGGIDLMNHTQLWSKEDSIWLSSMGSLVSICLQLTKARNEALRERTFLTDLFRYMPLGYTRLRKVYDEVGYTVDYEVLEANEMSSMLVGTPLNTYAGKLISENHFDHIPMIGSILEGMEEDAYKDMEMKVNQTGRDCRCIAYQSKKDEVVILLLDTTETVYTRDALDKSELLFRNIFASIPVGVEIYDKDGFVIDTNKRDLEIFGIQREDIIGLNLFNNPHVTAEIQEKLYTMDEFDLQVDYSYDLANSYCKTDLTGQIELLVKVRRLYDKKGAPNGWITIYIDNTAQSNAAKRLQGFENLFRLISDFAKVGYAKLNFVNRQGYAIKQWYKNMGEAEDTPLSEVVGVYSKIHPEDRKDFLAFFPEAMAGRKTNYRNEVRVLVPGKTNKWNWVRVHIVVTELKPEAGIMEIVGINYDITELKATEEKLIEAKEKAEEADRLKSAFVANMSHEIRTPLNAIVGFSGMLMETEDLEERKEYINIVEENNALLLQLISDILDLSRIEAGIFDFTQTEVDLNGLCEDIVRAFQLKVSPDVKLYFDVNYSDYSVIADRHRLHQIISNFVNNAVKFTSKGSIRVNYEVEEQVVRFSVTDTGLGISWEKQSQVFERFVKLNGFIQGTGLGLPICKNIVEQMGGEIGVDSEPGQGSRFWFTLPNIRPE